MIEQGHLFDIKNGWYPIPDDMGDIWVKHGSYEANKCCIFKCGDFNIFSNNEKKINGADSGDRNSIDSKTQTAPKGEDTDPDSGLAHLGHCASSLAILWELEKRKKT